MPIARSAVGLHALWPGPAAAAGESDPVTFALDATGSGTRYDVHNDTDMDAVPFGTLVAGDVVNIYYSGGTPYTKKLMLRGQGTQANPIILNGVTDASGHRPKLNFAGAQTAQGCTGFSTVQANAEALGGIVIIRGLADDYGTYKPKWIKTLNLECYGANANSAYISRVGDPVNYTGGPAGIRFQPSADCLVENCVVTDNADGIFAMAKDGLYSQACERLTLRKNQVYGCGVVDSFSRHGCYIQCANPLIEGNYFGQLRPGALGASYKSRANSEVFRNNLVISSLIAIDQVESSDQEIDGISTLSDYGLDYVYGNVIINDTTLPDAAGAGAPVHYGGDNYGGDDDVSPLVVPDEPYRFRLHFWNNTYITNTPSAERVFRLMLVATEAIVWNNTIKMLGGGAYTWLQWCGQLTKFDNTVTGSAADARADANPARYTITNTGSPPSLPSFPTPEAPLHPFAAAWLANY